MFDVADAYEGGSALSQRGCHENFLAARGRQRHQNYAYI